MLLHFVALGCWRYGVVAAVAAVAVGNNKVWFVFGCCDLSGGVVEYSQDYYLKEVWAIGC